MVRLTDRPDITLDVNRGRKTTMQQQQYIEKGGKYTNSRVASLESVGIALTRAPVKLQFMRHHFCFSSLYT